MTESLARAITQVRPPPSELTIGSDALYRLNALRHLPPSVYEALIWRWSRGTSSALTKPPHTSESDSAWHCHSDA